MDSMNNMGGMNSADGTGSMGNMGSMGGTNGSNNPANMGNGQHMYMHNSFWLPDRVSLTFQVTLPSGEQATIENVTRLVRQQVAILNERLRIAAAEHSLLRGVSLQFFGGNGPDAVREPVMFTYLFVPPSAPNTAQVVSFLEIQRPGPRLMDMAGGVVPAITNTLNAQQRPDDSANKQMNDATNSPLEIVFLGAGPTWLSGTTGDPDPFGHKANGCPLSPPVPVPASLSCADAQGRYPITLPDLPHELQAVTGDGVTVIVLDTMPKQRQLARAAEATEEHNLLMLDVVNNMTINDFRIVDGTDTPGPDEPVTGKDIYGRLVGFRMPDHGLFVSGIIRDLAPDANLESYRVLNDFCAGSVQTIITALNMIYNRMTLPDGDLNGKPVVINMSLVIPDDMDVTNAGIHQNTLDQTRQNLQVAIQNLIDVGAVFVASAGNEGDQRYNPMSPDRPNALYPAAFVYNGLTTEQMHGMIPVGAVGSDGTATTYSCYPGPNGVASYGGSLPDVSTDVGKNSAGMTTVQIHDGVIGLYSSLNYPALSLDDPEAEYPAPNSRGWAYWIGTSFATPIVSALAARALELRMRNPASPHAQPVPNIVSGGVTGNVMWDRLGTDTIPHIVGTNQQGGMIHAVQCKGETHSHHHGHHEHGEEEVEVNVTNVYLVEKDADAMLEQ